MSKGLSQDQVSFSKITVVSDVKTEGDLGVPGDSPHIKNMIEKALNIIGTPFVGLINADIVLTRDFQGRFQGIVNRRGPCFFLSSVRKDVQYDRLINSEEEYKRFFEQAAVPHQDKSADLFISSKELFFQMMNEIPDFIFGRTIWDNWIHLHFKNKGIPCYNSSEALPCFHIGHNYDHLKVPLGKHKSVQRNMSLVKNFAFIPIGTWPQQ